MTITAPAPADAQSASSGLAHLRSGRRLLAVAVAAYEEVECEDVLETVRAAQGQIEAYFDAHTIAEDSLAAYDALDLVMLARAVLEAGLQIESAITMDPVRAALRMATEKLCVAIAGEARP